MLSDEGAATSIAVQRSTCLPDSTPYNPNHSPTNPNIFDRLDENFYPN